MIKKVLVTLLVTVDDEDEEIDLGIAKLDGTTIKLAQPAHENDTIIIDTIFINSTVISSP